MRHFYIDFSNVKLGIQGEKKLVLKLDKELDFQLNVLLAIQ